MYLFPHIGLTLCQEFRKAEQVVLGTCYCFDFFDGCRILGAGLRLNVQVRILLDSHQFMKPSCKSQPARVNEMIQWGAELRRYSPQRGSYSMMHAKSWLIDGSVLITGSPNFTHNGMESSGEVMTVVQGAQDCITKYLEWFEHLWGLAQVVHAGEMI